MVFRPLVWVDVETGGLNPATDALLEVGIIITDEKLEERDVFRKVATTKQSGVVTDFARKMHRDSGLLAQCEASEWTPQEVLASAGAWLAQFGMVPNVGPMFGSSVHFDRAFLGHYDPEFVKLFAYRNVDVSSIKETAKLLGIPDPSEAWPKAHTALEDIRRSKHEFGHYMRLLSDGWDFASGGWAKRQPVQGEWSKVVVGI